MELVQQVALQLNRDVHRYKNLTKGYFMKILEAIDILDAIWKQVPLLHEVNKKAQEAIKVLRDEFDKSKEKKE